MSRSGLEILVDVVAALSGGRFADAHRLLVEAVDTDPSVVDSVEYQYISGVINAQSGQIQSGIEQILGAYRREPRKGAIAKKLGEIYLQLGNVKKAGHYLLRSHRMKSFEGREDVFVFGDSHSEFCFGGIPRCKVHWLGPVTMHRIGRDGLDILDFRAKGVPENATVVLVFGEIDVRTHVLRQRDDTGRDLDEIMMTLCTSYLRTALTNRARYEALKVVICSLVPPTNYGNNPELPFYGSLAERSAITRGMNERLAALCAANGLLFMNIHKYFAEWSGSLNRFYADNTVHIRKEFHDIVEYELSVTAGL
jgi:hypothetical protein